VQEHHYFLISKRFHFSKTSLNVATNSRKQKGKSEVQLMKDNVFNGTVDCG